LSIFIVLVDIQVNKRKEKLALKKCLITFAGHCIVLFFLRGIFLLNFILKAGIARRHSKH